jgi:hypothetical protein
MADDFKACCVEGCNTNAANSQGGRRGFCSSHYYRWKLDRPDKCSVPACERALYAKGFCNLHWKRWSDHGTPTGGRAFNGEPYRFLTETVFPYEGDECLIWPYARDNHGSAKINTKEGMKYVARLVCEKKHGPPPSNGMDAAHSCGNGHLACVTKRHLSWKTHIDNMADMFIHNTTNRGERNGMSKLSADNVRAIRRMLGKTSQTQIARLFEVDPSAINNIAKGKHWGWLP